MTDTWHDIVEFLQTHEADLLTWSMPVILLILAVMLGLPSLRNWWNTRRQLRRIGKLGSTSIHDVVISDDIDGIVYLEHVVLNPVGIFILPLKCYRGSVFAADKIDTWTQVTGKRSYKFPNPLLELESSVLAVRNLVPDVVVEGRILVTNDADFPKGKPDKVITLSDAENQLRFGKKADVPAKLVSAWKTLANNANKLDQSREYEPLEQTHERRGNRLLIGILVLIALAWLTWRYQ